MGYSRYVYICIWGNKAYHNEQRRDDEQQRKRDDDRLVAIGLEAVTQDSVGSLTVKCQRNPERNYREMLEISVILS